MNNNKSMTVKEAFDLAVQNHQNNNLQNAKNYYQKVLEIDSSHEKANNNLGVLFQDSGDYKKAIICYEKVIEINPSYAHAYYNLGNLFRKLKESQKAKEFYEKVIKIDPSYVNAHSNLGGIFNELGDHQKAIICYEKVIKIDPSYLNAHYNLGVTFQELGDNQKAKICYEKTIAINPNYVNAHNSLGNIFQELGEFQKEFNCYLKAIVVDSNNVNSINNLTSSLQRFKFSNELKKNKNNFKKLILLLFKKNNINHRLIFNCAKSILFIDINNQIKETINSDSSLLLNNIIQKLLKEELFHLILQKSLIIDEFLEKLLTKLRCEILLILDKPNQNILKEYFDFIASLAEQFWFNEYVYIQSEKEIKIINKLKDKIEHNIKINELEIIIFACYVPLNSSKIITNKLLNYKSVNIIFNDLIDIQIKEPLKEIELAKSIQSLDKIIDPVSIKVKEQYEENPYPRWRYSSQIPSKKFSNILNNEIKPNKVDYNIDFNNPDILIAGCGTGNHSISASRYEDAKILAVDLSLKSLAYAKRKTNNLGLKNIEYLQADILQLKNLNKKFDIIECAGTLHHMKNPLEGLKVLLDILKPHGFLKIGLYSELARKNIIKARELINKKNFKNINIDFKFLRQEIINNKEDPLYKRLILSEDFYSTSGVRDLLFNVQEHRFTIKEISKILKDFNLEFLGFFSLNPFLKKEFSRSFPNDEKNISLENWNKFEVSNPNIFGQMYQFWVRKI